MPLLPSFLPQYAMSGVGGGGGGGIGAEPPLHYREGVQLAPPTFSICVTGVMSKDGSWNVTRTLSDGSHIQGTIRYRIFRPRQVHMQSSPPPLVVLHGGPSVPSNYLLPLVNIVTDRAIIFYDQLGCGRSSRPTQEDAYSIPLAVDDLVALMKEWKLSAYHLYGHSYGGILAFEYLKQTRDTRCLSVILSGAPTSTALVEEESQRLLQDLQEECDLESKQALERFRQVHECKALPIPLSLLDAYAQAGTVWRGIQAIPNYKAELGLDETPLSQPAFLVRGQDDFITAKCMKDWEKLFCDTQTMGVAGCSHHALLENEQLYGNVVSTFLVDHDSNNMTNNDNTKVSE